jgi:hypothetical protein
MDYKVIHKSDSFGIEIEGEFSTRAEAELRLIDVIANTISNFDEYESEDIDCIMDKGFEHYGRGVIFIEENGRDPF